MSLQPREVILFELNARNRGSEVGGLDEQKMPGSDSEASWKKNKTEKRQRGKEMYELDRRKKENVDKGMEQKKEREEISKGTK